MVFVAVNNVEGEALRHHGRTGLGELEIEFRAIPALELHCDLTRVGEAAAVAEGRPDEPDAS